MGGGANESPRASIGNLITLLVEGYEVKRILLTDVRCLDALIRRTGRPDGIIPMRDPLGRAILNRSAGECCTYRDGNCSKVVEILAVDPGPVL